jgi:hypothetical protein
VPDGGKVKTGGRTQGRGRLQPKPKGRFSTPESYAMLSCGLKPERPGDVAIGTLIQLVSVTELAANFAPMPRIASPPLGSVIVGHDAAWYKMGSESAAVDAHGAIFSAAIMVYIEFYSCRKSCWTIWG